MALTAAGFGKAFNVAGGFEGDVDGEGHRGSQKRMEGIRPLLAAGIDENTGHENVPE